MLELTTSVFTLNELMGADISAYDSIYLGDPFCRAYPENLSDNEESLKNAVDLLRKKNKKVYVSTYAVPRNGDLDAVRKTLNICQSLNIDAVEVHNFGVLRIARAEFPNLKVHMGNLANIYTLATALILKNEGAKRIMGNYELCLDELLELKDKSGIQLELLVHGKMVLGISESCLLKNWIKGLSGDCKELCRSNYYLRSSKMTLKSFGFVTLSGKDACMIERLPVLLKKGFCIFRIETFGEKREYVGKVGRIYREALSKAKEPGYDPSEYLKVLNNLSPHGFCNGYYFATSGQKYISL